MVRQSRLYQVGSRPSSDMAEILRNPSWAHGGQSPFAPRGQQSSVITNGCLFMFQIHADMSARVDSVTSRWSHAKNRVPQRFGGWQFRWNLSWQNFPTLNKLVFDVSTWTFHVKIGSELNVFTFQVARTEPFWKTCVEPKILAGWVLHWSALWRPAADLKSHHCNKNPLGCKTSSLPSHSKNSFDVLQTKGQVSNFCPPYIKFNSAT